METDAELSENIRKIIRESIRKKDENLEELLASLDIIEQAAENIKKIVQQKKAEVEASIAEKTIKEKIGVSKKLVPVGYTTMQ